MTKKEFKKDELLHAIKRSGYLFESEIAKSLVGKGFFVESNQVIEDPITGKSREIDLTAEYYDSDRHSGIKACAKVKFVFEIKNNAYPLVLLTKYEFSPNIELWESLKEIQTGSSNTSIESYYEKLLTHGERIFTQYCSFEVKKGGGKEEVFATHPEQVHTGLSKITQYCEEACEDWEGFEADDTYFRKFLYMPVFLIKDDLFELELQDGEEPFLRPVEESRLLFNYHYKNRAKLATVWVVTKTGLDRLIDSVIAMESKLESEMVAALKR